MSVELKQIAVTVFRDELYLYGVDDLGEVWYFDAHLEGWAPLSMEEVSK